MCRLGTVSMSMSGARDAVEQNGPEETESKVSRRPVLQPEQAAQSPWHFNRLLSVDNSFATKFVTQKPNTEHTDLVFEIRQNVVQPTRIPTTSSTTSSSLATKEPHLNEGTHEGIRCHHATKSSPDQMSCCGKPMCIPTPTGGGGGRPYGVHKPGNPYGPKKDNRRRIRLPGGYQVTLESLFYTYLVLFFGLLFYRSYFPYGWQGGWKGRAYM